MAARRSRRWRAATGSSTSITCCRPTRAPTSTSWSASAARSCRGPTSPSPTAAARARSCRATTTDARAPAFTGAGGGGRQRRRTGLQAVPEISDPARPRPPVSSSWVTRTEGDTDVCRNSRPSPFSPLRRRRSRCPPSPRRTSTFASARRRRAMRSFRARARRLRLGARLLGLARPSPRLGARPLGARAPRLRLPRAEVGAGRRSLAPAPRLVGARRPRPRRRSERGRRVIPTIRAGRNAALRRPAQKPEPGCLMKAISSAVDWRPRMSLRCGKRAEALDHVAMTMRVVEHVACSGASRTSSREEADRLVLHRQPLGVLERQVDEARA